MITKMTSDQASDVVLEEYMIAMGQLPTEGATPELFECAAKFLSLINTYGYSVRFAICLLDPIARLRFHIPKQPNTLGKKNRPVQMKLYINPYTGEQVRSKGGNLKVLMEWRKKYGTAIVSTWWHVEES